jgi:hypothetical protein
METLAQQMIAGHYGKSVNPSFVAIEIAPLVLGHAAATLDDELCKRIDAAQAKSAAGQATFERELAAASVPKMRTTASTVRRPFL